MRRDESTMWLHQSILDLDIPDDVAYHLGKDFLIFDPFHVLIELILRASCDKQKNTESALVSTFSSASERAL